jgi:hypothetical protein
MPFVSCIFTLSRSFLFVFCNQVLLSKTRIMNRHIQGIVIILAIITGQNLTAQNHATEVSELVKQIITSRENSNNLLSKYCWTSRTEILKSKEILNIMIEKNQYDMQGQLVQKILNEQSAKMPKAFLIREIAESEKENIEKFLFGLRDFLKKYSLQETAQVKRFIATATWQVVDSTHEFIFNGRNIEEDGDHMMWIVDDMHYSTARIEVTTKFQEDIVHFTGTFVRLKDGLNYLAYAEAIIPSRNITLQLQNYDYMRE